MSDHHCHAAGCSVKVPPKMFTCLAHWRKVPRVLQRAIWREYRDGQEKTKAPSLDYLAVQQCAVAFLAWKDHRPDDMAKAGANAVIFEAKCRELGREPLQGLPRVWETA